MTTQTESRQSLLKDASRALSSGFQLLGSRPRIFLVRCPFVEQFDELLGSLGQMLMSFMNDAERTDDVPSGEWEGFEESMLNFSANGWQREN